MSIIATFSGVDECTCRNSGDGSIGIGIIDPDSQNITLEDMNGAWTLSRSNPSDPFQAVSGETYLDPGYIFFNAPNCPLLWHDMTADPPMYPYSNEPDNPDSPYGISGPDWPVWDFFAQCVNNNVQILVGASGVLVFGYEGPPIATNVYPNQLTGDPCASSGPIIPAQVVRDQEGGSGLNEIQTVSIPESIFSGGYTLTFSGGSAFINYSTDIGDQILYALAAIVGEGNVQLDSIAPYQVTFEFVGALAGTSQPLVVMTPAPNTNNQGSGGYCHITHPV